MFNGPFRSFKEPSTQHCMQDFADGYFPSELQSKFPDGIPFQVSDRRDVTFQERKLYADFPGVGQTIDGSRLTVEQFLRKLPRNVIKGGKVIDIREEIGDTSLTGCCAPPASLFWEASEIIMRLTLAHFVLIGHRLKVKEKNRSSLDTITTLRIKSENGEQTYIAKMLFSETVRELRSQPLVDYDIVSSFPQQVYSDLDKTLEEYGLVPNAMLMLQACKH
uniref:UBX domain-containing protein 11 n=1 Tax=Callorhinchus milii TaxID=7868 RepID=A0A4W3KEK6_CALMI